MFKAFLLFAILAVAMCSEDICPQAKFQKCEAEAQTAFQKCEAAAKEKGQDQKADIDCVKYFMAARVDCWPCICQIAKKYGYDIKGCATLSMIEQLTRN